MWSFHTPSQVSNHDDVAHRHVLIPRSWVICSTFQTEEWDFGRNACTVPSTYGMVSICARKLTTCSQILSSRVWSESTAYLMAQCSALYSVFSRSRWCFSHSWEAAAAAFHHQPVCENKMARPGVRSIEVDVVVDVLKSKSQRSSSRALKAYVISRSSIRWKAEPLLMYVVHIWKVTPLLKLWCPRNGGFVRAKDRAIVATLSAYTSLLAGEECARVRECDLARPRRGASNTLVYVYIHRVGNGDCL